ncbi:MAG: KH domain-containing protein [Clostridiales bacterium]|nr:KH domain-containing protein [Clostridiales bacterium]
MSELLTCMAKALVNNPDEVSVKKTERGNTVAFELSVAPDDMGKIIGKNGKRAQAIRSIMKAKYVKTGKRVVVDIVE